MSNSAEIDDHHRYREMLQRSLLTSGWETAFEARRFSEWARDNRERLADHARAVLGGNGPSAWETHVTEIFERFVPRTQYELPTTEAIFRPLFDAVLECAEAIGLPPIRNVELVTSTSISPSPFARPTSDVHQLFIGPGTSMFCNYWAKAFNAVVTSIRAQGPPFPRVQSASDLNVHLSRDPRGLMLATRLALYYAATGSLIGFGEIAEPPGSYLYRTQLLSAMEVFVVSHEYAHFVADERRLEFVDETGQSSTQSLELFCDELGLQLTREWGSRHENWLAFTGVGANQSSYPATSERLRQIARWTTTKTTEDQRDAVQAFLGEYVVICEAVRAKVLEITSAAIASATTS